MGHTDDLQKRVAQHNDPEVRELRGLLSLQRKLKRQAQGLQLRIRNNLLAQYFPEMDQYYDTGEKESAISK